MYETTFRKLVYYLRIANIFIIIFGQTDYLWHSYGQHVVKYCPDNASHQDNKDLDADIQCPQFSTAEN